MNLLFAILVSSAPAHAGWVKDFCARHLVAEDPYPFAEYSTKGLIDIYSTILDEAVRQELLFRFRAHMLEPDEREQVLELLRVGP